jgi:hypothetical protein
VPNSVSVDTVINQKLHRMMVAEYYRPIQVLHSFPEKDRSNPILNQYMQRQRALIDGNLKYLWREKGKAELYDLGTDPLEKVDLLDNPQFLGEAERLKSALFTWVAANGGEPPDASENPKEALDPEVIESLKTLGYLPN